MGSRIQKLEGAQLKTAESVTCVGDVMLFLPVPEDEFRIVDGTCIVRADSGLWGGSAVEIAQHLADQGRTAAVVGLVGRGDEAEFKRKLQARDVDIAGAVVHEGTTNLLLSVVGESHRSIFVGGRNSPVVYGPLGDNLRGHSFLIFGGSRDSQFRSVVLDRVRENDVFFIFAPSYSIETFCGEEIVQFSANADVVFLNEREFRVLCSAVGGERQATTAAPICIVTRAERGATIYAHDDEKQISSKSGSRSHVIGAGDAFVAGFVDAWLAEPNAYKAGEAGAELAGRFVRERLASL
jgi:sugar/nucleoside kinase (ribokinase family)